MVGCKAKAACRTLSTPGVLMSSTSCQSRCQGVNIWRASGFVCGHDPLMRVSPICKIDLVGVTTDALPDFAQAIDMCMGMSRLLALAALQP